MSEPSIVAVAKELYNIIDVGKDMYTEDADKDAVNKINQMKKQLGNLLDDLSTVLSV